MEIFTHLILPNIALFGSIYAAAKLFEQMVWYNICNYDKIAAKLKIKG